MPVPIAIVVDTSEQRPWTFTRQEARCSTGNLKRYGSDYTVRGYGNVMGIERKSITDWFSSIGGDWPRFKKSLAKLKKLRYRCIIVEGTLTDANVYGYLDAWTAAARCGQIMANGIPVLFADTREHAMHCALEFFRVSVKRRIHDLERQGDD